MKKTSIIILLLIVSISVFAQKTFQHISFENAIKLSGETGKLIFLQFESATCNRCNEVANKAFEDKELTTKLEQTLICIKIGPSDADRETIGTLYNVKEGFGSLFIDQNKTLIHSFLKSTTRAADYKEQIDLAIYKSGEEVRINELEREYRNGNKSIEMMELLLRKRKGLNLETDSLLDEYVQLLPADSLNSLSKLVFIAQMAPVIGSTADAQLHRNDAIFNKAWLSISFSDRFALNNRITNKSIEKAIREKNETYAYKVASFIGSTFKGNLQIGKKYFDYNMLKFYKETNDTVKYQVRAIDYYDNYYMTVSVDSIKKADSVKRSLQASKQKPVAAINKTDTGNFKRRQVIQFAYSPMTQNFTSELNNAALSFYKMFNDPLNTNKALQWSKRANEFYETPEAMDTYARLLYKTGNKTEAISWEEKAIMLQKKRGFPVAELEAILANIKQGKPNIDN
jgi:hypothetical protein